LRRFASTTTSSQRREPLRLSFRQVTARVTDRETLLSHTFVSAIGSPSHPKAKITTTLDFCTTLF
jgi:hypothetical protein